MGHEKEGGRSNNNRKVIYDSLQAEMGLYVHRLTQFREKEAKHKLHFGSKQKKKMARACQKYYMAIYKLDQ